MLLGTRRPFVYTECAQCLSVQLMNPPADLSPYYPDNYYSFQPGSRDSEEPPAWPATTLSAPQPQPTGPGGVTITGGRQTPT